uniref:Uncharacterized protein AlNc14C48G3850 n=1 Tax=Albugo laibachii Nc14 TaxID=890382 RepID=F0WAZ0_9STRA|nr:conserved hypothetical protein [Albugo laibachii Nc14]CCA18415.1 conserved hypothetical protein [Albugo laibachii Nc14]|eukprot:CCA18415.1 conserved hypothetical protein [Albugo laibachii Nc14]
MNQYDAVEFRSVKAKIRAICKQRRIRLEEFMKTFDVHCVKKIKIDQFRRALDMSGVQLLSKEVDVIIAKYRIPNDFLFVDYRRFCDLIDKAFAIKGLETRPEVQKTKSIDFVEPKFGLEALTDVEAHVLDRIKRNLKTAAQTRGIVLKDVFRDLDHNNSGYVTHAEFTRGILDIVRLNESDLTILKKAYGNRLDVNYRALHYEISRSSSDPNGPIAHPQFPERRRLRVNCQGSELDGISDLESQLCQIATRDRIRVRSFFTDFDPFRMGKITCAQFERCVKICFPTISEPQLSLLTRKYATDNAQVDYAAFAAGFQGGEDALSKLTTTYNSSQCSRELRGQLDERENKVFDAMIKRLGSHCSTRRMNLKPAFQDFDRTRRECITTQQFFRVMDMLKLVISEQEGKVVIARYKSALDDSYINYVTFCLDLEQWDASNQRPNSANSHIIVEILSPLRLNEIPVEGARGKPAARIAPVLLRYMQQYAKQYRVRIEENFRDFDKLRHGKLTFAKFCAGLDACGFVVSPEEARILAASYACTETDAQGRRLVQWKNFVDDIDTAFTVKGLERTPLFNGPVAPSAMSEAQDLDADEEAQVTAAIRKIYSTMKRNRLEVKDALEDFDTAKHGYISSSKFERVLSVHKLLPETKLCRLLIRKFREKSPNPFETLVQIDYRAFLHALKLMENSLKTQEPLIIPDSKTNRKQVSGSQHNPMELSRRLRVEEQNESINLEQVVAKLCRQLTAKRIRLKEFITDGDKLRTGEITIPKFHTALNRCGCTLSANDIRTLTMQFQSSCHSDKIDWRAFLDTIEHSSSSQSDQNGENQHITPMRGGILDRLRLKVRHERLQLKPYLQDYDPMRAHRVTKSQFTAVLDRMKLGLQPSEAESLAAHFCVPSSQSRNKNPDIDYLAFLRSVGEVV